MARPRMDQKRGSRVSDDEIAEFLIKDERKKCNNTQNTLLGGCYLLFLLPVYILKPCREVGQSLGECLGGG